MRMYPLTRAEVRLELVGRLYHWLVKILFSPADQFNKKDRAKRYKKSLRGVGSCGPYGPEAAIQNLKLPHKLI